MSSSTSANYTKEEVKEILKQIENEYGKITKTIIKSESELTYTDIQKTFGTLTKAKAELGDIKSKHKLKWKNASREEFLESLHNCYEEHGKITQNILSKTNMYPSPKYIDQEFGSLSRAKLETGISELEQIRLSDEQLEELKPEFIEQIEECEEKYGRVSEKLMRNDNDFWNPGYIKKAFGTFSRAKQQANLDSSAQIHLTDSELEEINVEIKNNEHKREVLIGCILGDGTVHKPPEKSARFTMEMVNKQFLEWLSEELGDIIGHLSQRATAEELADKNKEYGYTVNKENYNDIYYLQSRAVPALNEFYEWYDSGQKRFPDSLNLTPTIAKIWYCCDGSLCENEYCVIYSANEIDRPEYLLNLFEDTPFNPSVHNGGGGVIQFTKEESRALLEWMGEAPPGFEYKWDINE